MTRAEALNLTKRYCLVYHVAKFSFEFGQSLLLIQCQEEQNTWFPIERSGENERKQPCRGDLARDPHARDRCCLQTTHNVLSCLILSTCDSCYYCTRFFKNSLFFLNSKRTFIFFSFFGLRLPPSQKVSELIFVPY